MKEKTELLARLQRWLDRSQSESAPYEVTIEGMRLDVCPGVFSPRYYPETAFYAHHLLDHVAPGTRYLDIGCGIGSTAVLAARRGAKVVAVDLNPAAVENCRRNAVRIGVTANVDVRRSDVFDALRPDERFDLVFWNIPFAYRRPETELTMLEEAIYDPGYSKHQRFFESVGTHLAPGGTILVGLSETLGDLSAIETIAGTVGIELELLSGTYEDGTDEPTMIQLFKAVPTLR